VVQHRERERAGEPEPHFGSRAIEITWTVGGMLMWVPGCLVYLSAILARVARWYNTQERVVDNMA
jgi:hypothetical protein